MKRSSLEHERPPSHRNKANFLSIVFFGYAIKTYKMYGCKKKEMQESDITRTLDSHKSAPLGERLARLWANEIYKARRKNKKPSMVKVVAKFLKKDLIILGIVVFIMEIFIRLLQPFCVGLYVRYFLQTESKPDPNSPTYVMRIFHYWSPQGPLSKGEAIFFAMGVIMSNLLSVIITHPYYMATLEMGMKLRVAACSLIYRKALRLSLTNSSENTANPVNLMSNDVMRFDFAFSFLHYIWLTPIQVFFIVVFTYMEVGNATFVGFAVLCIIMPIQSFFGKVLADLRFQIARRTDKRVRQMNEIIQSIQVIKMYAWEYAFANLIHKLRAREVRSLWKTAIVRGMLMSFIMFTARSATFLTAWGYVLFGDKITSDKVFIITTYYQILRQTLTVNFPNGIGQVAEAVVSIERIRRYMLIPESERGDPSVMDPDFLLHQQKTKQTGTMEVPEVVIESGYAKYGEELCLEDINIIMNPGITAIVGPVGSGKTCILNLILGELVLFSGSVRVVGTVSYASQEPWLFAGSVRQNILFGRDFDRLRYYETIKACSLLRDFQLLPHGDQTIIGERGVSLSGGQRARVNLARAVYAEADIYLLDDPLSAVDTQVGKALVEECLMDFLKGKIVVLVTHQLQYLEFADNIIIMNEGSVEGQGTADSLKLSGIKYSELMGQPIEMTGIDDDDHHEMKPAESALDRGGQKSLSDLHKTLTKSMITLDTTGSLMDKERAFTEAPVQEEVAEQRSVGALKCKYYWMYFRAGAPAICVLIMFLNFLMTQAICSGGDWYLAEWVLLEEYVHKMNDNPAPLLKDYTLRQAVDIYIAVICMTVVIVIFRALWFVTICMRASIRLHDRMFNSIAKGNMNFFYTNTSGRILNRFSKDMGCVDEYVPTCFLDTFQINLNLVGAVFVLLYLDWKTIFPTVILCIIFYFLRRLYLRCSTPIKRLEGITRSPVFSHLNASLQGLATIRSNHAEKILVAEFDDLQDTHSSVWFMFLYTSRAFGMWLDIVCAMYIGYITLTFLGWSADNRGSVVGLAITQCIGLSGLIQWGMRQSAELENQMTSVERVFEYIDIETEPALHSTPSKKPQKDWPSEGHIDYQDVSMTYKMGQHNVLSNLTLSVEPRQKIGIVGRTGAGKSSLISTLFRTVIFEGKVYIDDVDISLIGLHDLRKKISIIPQEPVIFSGSLRYNLDPFKEYNDESIYNALVTVENKAALTKGIDCLSDIMSEGGINLSVGERQLVCLARAILRKNKILIMDEVTANVDPQTDKFIQHTIRSKFFYCTVLTIAHRLHTIIDYDKVLVLDAGRLIEFDHPHLLLQKGGMFATLVKKTGPQMTENLKTLARNSYYGSNAANNANQKAPEIPIAPAPALPPPPPVQEEEEEDDPILPPPSGEDDNPSSPEDEN